MCRAFWHSVLEGSKSPRQGQNRARTFTQSACGYETIPNVADQSVGRMVAGSANLRKSKAHARELASIFMQGRYFGVVSIKPVVVKPISDDELIGDIKANIVGVELNLGFAGLAE